jgi:hypothetical protein
MFNVDDFVKVVLALSCSFALVGIAYAIIKTLNKVTDTIEDARKPIQNIGEVSEMAVDDYKGVRSLVTNVFGFTSVIKNLTSKFNSGSSKEEEEND